MSTGDLANVALRTSVSDVYTSMGLQAEFEALVRELEPIKGKCLGVVASNHHRRFEVAVGMSLDWLLTDKLGIPFLGKTGLICASCGGAHYYIAMHHGVGSGKRRGSKTNNTEDLAVLVPGADIYLEGHTHSYDFFINEQRYIDRKRGHDVRFPAYFCVTGHFLKYDDSYAEDFKLRPMPQGAAMLKLFYSRRGNFDRKKVKCDLFQ